MKKTYFAPELESVKITSVQILAGSDKLNLNPEQEGDGTVLSKGFSGSLWDDGDAEEN